MVGSTHFKGTSDDPKKLFFAQRNETMEHTCRMKSNFNAGDSSIDGRLLTIGCIFVCFYRVF